MMAGAWRRLRTQQCILGWVILIIICILFFSVFSAKGSWSTGNVLACCIAFSMYKYVTIIESKYENEGHIWATKTLLFFFCLWGRNWNNPHSSTVVRADHLCIFLYFVFHAAIWHSLRAMASLVRFLTVIHGLTFWAAPLPTGARCQTSGPMTIAWAHVQQGIPGK